jgi:hypothetical protein
MTYTNWYEGEPSNSQIGSFAYINFNFASNQGFWFYEIGSAYILFICESIDGGTATTDGTTTPSTTTPSTTRETTTPTTTTKAPCTIELSKRSQIKAIQLTLSYSNK